MLKFTEIVEIEGFHIHCISQDITITRHLKQGIYWELWTQEIMRLCYEPGTDMLDVGAHIGTSSLLMSRVVSPGCKVRAFEPAFAEILRVNIDTNGLSDRIQLYPYGLAEKQKYIECFTVNLAEQNNFGNCDLSKLVVFGEKPPPGIGPEGYVLLRTLDDVVREEAWPARVSFMKVDVEGCEALVMQGAVALIQRDRPCILMEMFCSSQHSRYEIEVLRNPAICQNTAGVMSLMSQLEYICFPVNLASDDVLFVHVSKTALIGTLVEMLPRINKVLHIQAHDGALLGAGRRRE